MLLPRKKTLCPPLNITMTTFKLKWPITFSSHTWLTMRFPCMSKFPIFVSFHIIHFFHNLHNKVILEPQVSHGNTSKYVDTVIVFAKTSTKGNWPLDDSWPNICWEVLCVTLPKDHCVQVPWEYIYVCGYSDLFFWKKKTWSKGHWPQDDLWPHICSGHMCDSTQGSLCPSPMKIHQSMWLQWPFLQKLEAKVIMTFDPTSVEVTCVTLPKDHCVQVPWELYINVCGYSDQFCKFTTYILHITYIHTTYRISDHSLSQARQKIPWLVSGCNN